MYRELVDNFGDFQLHFFDTVGQIYSQSIHDRIEPKHLFFRRWYLTRPIFGKPSFIKATIKQIFETFHKSVCSKCSHSYTFTFLVNTMTLTFF